MRKIVKFIKIILICLVILFFGLMFLIQGAFGPKYRTVKLSLDKNRTLIGKETYGADFAAEFYSVEFELQTKDSGVYSLGNATFNNENWGKNIKLYEIGDWYVFPAKEMSYAKLILTNKISHKSIDTTFSPQNLRSDSLYKSMYKDYISWAYYGKSRIDSIRENKVYVTYLYVAENDSNSRRFYLQMIEHKFDTITGLIRTEKIFERKETKPIMDRNSDNIEE